jgi:type VII secretion protein EccE
MSQTIPVPGAGRITLALLAIVPAAMAHPWHSTRAYWLIGIAVVAVIVLFGWWRGLYFTTIARRRLAMTLRHSDRSDEPIEGGPDARTTAVLRIGPPAGESDVLPLPLIARYLDCYGIRADKIRITSLDAGGVSETWIALTISAADNLAALQARSSRIPLHETAQVAARRLADHLRELGWEAGIAGPDDLPELLASGGGETWRGVRQGSNYLAAYRVGVDNALSETLAAVRSQGARETWTALEIAGPEHTVAVACALLTDSPPDGAPVPGMTPQNGNHRPALAALDLLSTQRLDGQAGASADLLARLVWPTPAAGAHRAPSPDTAATVSAAI